MSEAECPWAWSIPKDKAAPIIFQWYRHTHPLYTVFFLFFSFLQPGPFFFLASRLENAMEPREGATVPKREVHAHYVAFCKDNRCVLPPRCAML